MTKTLRDDQAKHFDSRSPYVPAVDTLRARGFEFPYILKDVMISQAILHGSPVPGARVLDVGCGKGILLDRLSATYGTVGYGVDVSQESLRAARSESMHIQQVATSEGEHLPFPDGSFDLTVSLDVIEHVMAPEVVLAEMVRVLKPGGTVLCYAVSRTNRFTLNWFLARALDSLGVDHWSRAGHAPDRLVDPASAVAQLERQGCRIELFRPFHAFFTLFFDQAVLVLYWLVERLRPPQGVGEEERAPRNRLLLMMSFICTRLLSPLDRMDGPWLRRGLCNGFLIRATKAG
jgi:ubiquinone/menaquinone biosynthesis C-methylase UbiE